MACELFTGTPGSGKSLHAAKKIRFLLRAKKTIIANFPINMECFRKRNGKMPKLGKFIYVPNSKLTVSYLKKFSFENLKPLKESQCLVIIDECQVKFNPRISRQDREEWVEFLPQHRKYGYDILLVTISDKFIDKLITTTVETEYKHRSMKNYGVWGDLFCAIFGNVFWVNSYWYGCKMKLSSEVFHFNKKLANLYNSFKLFDESDTDESKKEEKKEDGKCSESAADEKQKASVPEVVPATAPQAVK